jgi:nitrile hydratase alpha subunit
MADHAEDRGGDHGAHGDDHGDSGEHGDHGHDHGDHGADAHAPIREERPLTSFEQRTAAIQALLIEKGVLSADEVRRAVEDMDARNPALGAKVVARAWVDRGYKQRLLSDSKVALAELGVDINSLPLVQVVENSDAVHHVVVCTLCSCYPRAILGLPPDWYKSINYRSRMVSQPRDVLREFGTELDPEVEVRVLDSSADLRYLVIPARPAGTEGLDEEQLAALVTRDSMIGVARALDPHTEAVGQPG